MAGPIYHPVTPWAAHVAHSLGFSCAIIRVPSGAKGVVFKSNGPNTWTYADNFFFSRELRRRSSVMVALWTRQHHICMGSGVECANASDEVGFECLYCSFRRVTSIDVGWDQLVLNVFFLEEFFHCRGGFIIHHLEFGVESSICKLFV
jgi:hypothetical protein